MKIIHFMQFFTGPASPGTHQPRRLAKALADRGHLVEVVACDMNAYSEQLEPPEETYLDGGGRVRVHRIAVARGMRRSLHSRLRTYLNYAWSAMRFGLKLAKPDVVVASIQPMFTGLAALRVARRYRAPLLLEVRDLWPDALEAKGAVTGLQAKVLHGLANYLYARADRIVCLTPGIKTELVRKGLCSREIAVFPNGFDPQLFKADDGLRERVRSKYGWSGEFVALYTGTHTEVTAVDVIVRAAGVLRDHPGIRFDLFGQGQTKPAAIALARELNLSNVHFHDPVPRSEIPGLIAACDVAVITLFESRLEHIYFENKFVDYMGAGCAIVGALGGQQAEIITRHETGRVVPPLDHEGLAKLVVEARQAPGAFAEMGKNGKKLVAASLMLPEILDRYCRVIEDLAAGRSQRGEVWEPLL